jgi:hypothetical protein
MWPPASFYLASTHQPGCFAGWIGVYLGFWVPLLLLLLLTAQDW